MKLAILITNPNHHLELTQGVAKLAKAAGDEVKYISLCEMRRMPSPVETFEDEGLDFVKFTDLPQQLKPSSGKRSLGKSDSVIRKLVQKTFWLIKLKPFITKVMSEVDKVLLMNDAAYPGDHICKWLKGQKIPFYLLQEGVRFPLPTETEVKYGGNGAKKLLAWGDRSAAHFISVVQPTTEVVVTGSPRFDKFLKKVEKWPVRKRSVKKLGVFTNPIDDQGFCTKEEKLTLFESFVMRSVVYLNQNKITLTIKTHPREEVQEYLSIASKYISQVEKSPKDIFEAIMDVDAGVIMASTVGLELLGAKRALAQMEIPSFGYVFDYTDNSNVLKIPLQGDFEISSIFENDVDMNYFNQHIQQTNSSKLIYEHLK